MYINNGLELNYNDEEDADDYDDGKYDDNYIIYHRLHGVLCWICLLMLTIIKDMVTTGVIW